MEAKTFYVLSHIKWFGDDADAQVVGIYSTEETLSRARASMLNEIGLEEGDRRISMHLSVSEFNLDFDPVTRKPL